MSRALKSGAPRILGRHDGARGRWFDRHYRALVNRLGPFDAMTKDYAAAVAGLWVEWRSASEALSAAQRQRREGRGRRPGTATIARLQKRQGLAWQTYDQALRRLEELTRRQMEGRHPFDLMADPEGVQTPAQGTV